jgi:hypothetical protein
MFDSAALDVSIGLILVYIVLSLMSSAITELFEGWLKHRAIDLEKGMRELLADSNGTGLAKSLYDHPLISSLFQGHYDPSKLGNLPSYIPSRNFALALMDIALPAQGATPSGASGAVAAAPNATGIAALRSAVSSIHGNDSVKRALLTLIDSAGNDITQVRTNIEQWFDTAMDRVSGWYKRRKQFWIFVIGLIVALVMNVSTVTVATALWTNKTMRDSLVAAANRYVAQTGGDARLTPKQQLDHEVEDLQSFRLPIGWTLPASQSRDTDLLSIVNKNPDIWLERVLGWLLTACAVSFGAPFWFDLLGKVSIVRSTIKPQEKSPAAPVK